MRYMIIVKANKDSEAGVMPTEQLIAAMAQFHEELAAAGALLDASGFAGQLKSGASGTVGNSVPWSMDRSPKLRS